MKISIVVPCYNMEAYIEETLLSIINQKYYNLELIVVDGGSTDNTLSIIAKYEQFICLLISEKDDGQYYAINKGLSLATGDVLAWLNADDVYFPWTFDHVSNFFLNHSEVSWISGATSVMNEKGLINGLNNSIISKPTKFIENGWFQSNLYGYLQQEGMFWRKELWDNSGGLNEDYKLAGDFDLWTRFVKFSDVVSFGLPLASFRKRQSSRSSEMKDEYENEVATICSELKKVNRIIRFLGKYSFKSNLLVRKLTLSKSSIYYFSPLNKKWTLKEKYSSLSSHSWSKILFLK